MAGSWCLILFDGDRAGARTANGSGRISAAGSLLHAPSHSAFPLRVLRVLSAKPFYFSLFSLSAFQLSAFYLAMEATTDPTRLSILH